MKNLATFFVAISFHISCSKTENSFTDSVGTQNGGNSGLGGDPVSGEGGGGGKHTGGHSGNGGGPPGSNGGQAGSNSGQAGLFNGGSSGTQNAGTGGSMCEKTFWKPISKAPIDENRISFSSATNGKTVTFGGGITDVFDGPDLQHPDSATYDPISDTWTANGYFEKPSFLRLISNFGNKGEYAHAGYLSLWVTNNQKWEKVVNKSTNIESINWGKMFFVDGKLIFWGVVGSETKIFKYNESQKIIEEIAKDKKIPYSSKAASSVSEDGKLLIWGGTNEDGQLTNNGYLYNIISDSWIQVSSSPIEARNHSHMVWMKDKFLIWGGYINENEQELGGAEYSPQDNTWKQVQDEGSKIKARSLHWTGAQVLFWGGENSFFYSPQNGAWEKLSNCGAPKPNPGSAQWTEYGLVVWGDGNPGHIYQHQ